LIEDLTALGAKVVAFDPVAMENAKKILGDRIRYAGGAMEALEGADALAVVTEWNEFRHPDFSLMRSKMKSAVIFDGRNVFDPQKMKDHGFTYTGMGRGQIAGLRR
jgi:UDPglucose 6-dehydrogenase